MTIPWVKRADEAKQKARQFREQAETFPMRTHARKRCLFMARQFEREAARYNSKAQGADQ